MTNITYAALSDLQRFHQYLVPIPILYILLNQPHVKNLTIETENRLNITQDQQNNLSVKIK